MTLTLLQRKPGVPNDLPQILRDMADAMERGEITSFVCALGRDGNYETYRGCPLRDALVLSTILHDRIVEAFKE